MGGNSTLRLEKHFLRVKPCFQRFSAHGRRCHKGACMVHKWALSQTGKAKLLYYGINNLSPLRTSSLLIRAGALGLYLCWRPPQLKFEWQFFGWLPYWEMNRHRGTGFLQPTFISLYLAEFILPWILISLPVHGVETVWHHHCYASL